MAVSSAKSYGEAVIKQVAAREAGDPITLWELNAVQYAMLRDDVHHYKYMQIHPRYTLLGIPFIIKDSRS